MYTVTRDEDNKVTIGIRVCADIFEGFSATYKDRWLEELTDLLDKYHEEIDWDNTLEGLVINESIAKKYAVSILAQVCISVNKSNGLGDAAISTLCKYASDTTLKDIDSIIRDQYCVECYRMFTSYVAFHYRVTDQELIMGMIQYWLDKDENAWVLDELANSILLAKETGFSNDDIVPIMKYATPYAIIENNRDLSSEIMKEFYNRFINKDEDSIAYLSSSLPLDSITLNKEEVLTSAKVYARNGNSDYDIYKRALEYLGLSHEEFMNTVLDDIRDNITQYITWDGVYKSCTTVELFNRAYLLMLQKQETETPVAYKLNMANQPRGDKCSIRIFVGKGDEVIYMPDVMILHYYNKGYTLFEEDIKYVVTNSTYIDLSDKTYDAWVHFIDKTNLFYTIISAIKLVLTYRDVYPLIKYFIKLGKELGESVLSKKVDDRYPVSWAWDLVSGDDTPTLYDLIELGGVLPLLNDDVANNIHAIIMYVDDNNISNGSLLPYVSNEWKSYLTYLRR